MKLGFTAFAMTVFFATHVQAQAISLEQAIRKAVLTNPAVGEATANRRATEFELRQRQGALLPQVRLQADIGPERRPPFDSIVGSRPNEVVNGRQANIVVRQVVFDGFASLNETWRQAARVDAASWRVQERAELVALDTVQSYTDVVRLREMIVLAERNVQTHRKLLSDVTARFEGGRAGSGDRDQVIERVQAAEAAKAELVQRLGDSAALFHRSVGQQPKGLVWPGRPAGLPKSQAEALRMAYVSNPTIRAADADLDAVKAQREVARGADYPTVAVEAQAAHGKDTQNFNGRYDDLSVKLSASWLLYSGGTDTARQSELVERVGEQQMRVSLLRRQAIESIERAWSTRSALDQRSKALRGQVAAAERVVGAYGSEYELGQRTLLDLLNAEQSLYNARIALVNARGLAVFADYQILAASGALLTATHIAAPAEANTPLRGLKDTGAFMPPIDLFPRRPPEPALGN